MRTDLLTHHLPAAIALALLAFGGCTARLYEGEARRREDVAVIHVGDTVVRRVDGQGRRGGALDVSSFEVPPGPHRLRLVFELPSRNLGMKILPAQPGIGVCDLAFEARAGRQYYLGARAVGDISDPRWPGTWEAWVRDPAVSEDDDVIARCQGAEPIVTPTAAAAAAAPATGPEAAAPSGAPAAAAPVAAVAASPTPAALAPPPGAAVRVGAWQLPGLDRATTAELADIAPAIEAGFDVLTIEPSFDARRLLGLLGSGWASSDAAPRTVLYRRAVVRPCSRPAAVTPCLESAGAAPGEQRPLLLDLQPTGRTP